MRLPKLLLTILTASAWMSAAADTLPQGTYSLFAQTTLSGIHQSVDQGTLSGTVTFNASSQITVADLIFKDLSDGLSFTFTVPGVTTYTPQAHLLDAKISNAVNPATAYFFSISAVPIGGTYRLTCGTDCLNYLDIPDATGTTTLYEEVLGNLTPAAVTPEPSTFVLLGTGLMTFTAVIRRRAKMS